MSEHNFERLQDDVRTIKDAILGEGLHKDNGLLDRQKKIEKKVSEHEKVLWMMGGVLTFVSVILAILKLFSPIEL